jgi:selenium-binding protein 1
MATWRPDPSFYPSPKTAGTAPVETLAYVALMNPNPSAPDALAVLDLDSGSATYGQFTHRVDMPVAGDELHHFGWNACSSCLCPYAPHPHMERRYLIVPGMRSSRIHVLDTRPDPRRPRITKVIEPDEVIARSGYSRPHTSHCGPDGIYMNALGAPAGDGPGGIFVMDPQTFEIKGRWESDRGPQYLAYDFWWHLGHDTMITSEWGTPQMVEEGVNPELLLAGKYGHALHVWDLHTRRHLQTLDLGAEQQMVLELRPAHDPAETYGFVGVVTSLKDLSASVWMWYREGGNGNGSWKIRKVIEIPQTRQYSRRSSKASAPCPPSSRTSISRSTIDPSVSPAGAPASSGAMTCRIRSILCTPDRSGSVGSVAPPRLRQPATVL